MEHGKTKCNSLLAFAVFVNLVLTLTSIGFLVYKVRVLEEQVFQLRTKSSVTLRPETRESEGSNLAHQRLKRSKSFGEQTCVSCHNACVKLFGLGAAAKVSVHKKSFQNNSSVHTKSTVGKLNTS